MKKRDRMSVTLQISRIRKRTDYFGGRKMKKISWLALLLSAILLPAPLVLGNSGVTGGIASLIQEETAEGTLAPAEEMTVPSEETVVPAEETTVPSEETVVPAEETTAPAEGASASAGEASAPAGDVLYTTARVNFRDKPGVDTDSTVLTVLDQGTSVTVIEESEEWSRCSIQDGTVGYIKKEYLSPEPPPPAPDSIICLTFDDGPSSDVTPRILDILKEYNVKATFFIVNYGDDKIPILKRMLEEGHTIGIHTWSHDYDVCYATMDSYYEGVLKMAEKIKTDLDYEPYCIRFPGGSSNTVSRKYTPGVMTYLAELMPSEGYQYYDWNADSTDAEGNNRPADTLYQNSVDEIQKNKTNILLCHDLNTKGTTADMLPRLIEYGLENGYRFEPITRDTKPVHHGINN